MGSQAVTLLYNPYQEAFLQARRRRLPDGRRAFTRLAVIAGRRGGKTLIGAVSALEEANTPQTVGWCCAPSFPHLHDEVIPAVKRFVPQPLWEKGWSEQHKELVLPNGSLIQFRSLDDPERGRGPGLHWLWIDEAREVAERAWWTIRPALTEHRGVAFFTSSSGGVDWVYKNFWLPAQREVPGFWAIKYFTSDNPLPAMREEVEAARREMPPKFFRREYEASFEHFEGAIFTDFDEARHVVDVLPDDLAGQPILVGLDPGADHPFAAVVIVARPEGLLVISGYSDRGKPVAAHLGAIRALLPPDCQPRWVIDRSAKQVAIELAQHGVYATGADNDVVAGIFRVVEWLRAGRLQLYRPGCRQLIDQLHTYRWAETARKSGELGQERPHKVDDDLVDALRYALMSWPTLPAPPTPSNERDLSTFPPAVAWAVARERQCGKGLPPLTGVLGDFYG